MELGATVCTPRQPRCDICPLAQRCFARENGCIDSLPNLGERVATTARRFVACVVEQDGSFLVRQRPAGVVNAHLWEFPNAEIPLRCSFHKAREHLEAELGCALHGFTPFTTVKHTITRYRITLEAFAGTLNGAQPAAGAGKWMSLARAKELSFTSAHGRVLRRLNPGD
jgi:A/G-specific adenine glycosylase